jgi:hypothetical protein
MSDITTLQRLWELQTELYDSEKSLLDAEHELVNAQAWVVRRKRDRDEASERLQTYKKLNAL